MGLLTLPFRLPFLPLQGVIKLGELLQEEAERQLYDPARIRRDLDEAQRRYEAGEISEEEFTQIQDELASTLVTEVAPPSVPGASQDRS
jgi:Gas vesicle protein G